MSTHENDDLQSLEESYTYEQHGDDAATFVSEESYDNRALKKQPPQRQFTLVRDLMKVVETKDRDSKVISEHLEVDKRRPVQVWETGNVPGCSIRNAITGQFEKHTVGSRAEDLYYSVIISTGETYVQQMYRDWAKDSMGKLSLRYNSATKKYDKYLRSYMTNEIAKYPHLLFFNSPEEYEDYMGVEVSDAAKMKWKLKYNAEVKRQNMIDERRQYGRVIVK